MFHKGIIQIYAERKYKREIYPGRSGSLIHTKNKGVLRYSISLKTPENGGYLLSHIRSTIGAAELNDPVRNGKGWDLSTITTSI